MVSYAKKVISVTFMCTIFMFLFTFLSQCSFRLFFHFTWVWCFCMQVEIFQNVYKFEVTEEALWYREEKLWGGSRDNLEETMEKIFCYLLPFSVNDEDIKVAAFTCNIESFAIAFLVFFFLVFLYGAVFRWTGNFSCLINFDLLPRASVTRIKLNSLDALIYIFLHLSIVIQDARDPWHTMCFREKK